VGYLDGTGAVSTECSGAVSFQIINGGLYGNWKPFSTNLGINSQPFVSSTTVGEVHGTFSQAGDMLHWSNDFFTMKHATFCLAGGVVQAVFSGLHPTNCAPVALFVVPKCVALDPSTAPSSASTTTSAVGVTTQSYPHSSMASQSTSSAYYLNSTASRSYSLNPVSVVGYSGISSSVPSNSSTAVSYSSSGRQSTITSSSTTGLSATASSSSSSSALATSSISSTSPSSSSATSSTIYAVPTTTDFTECYYDPTEADSVFTVVDPTTFAPFVNVDDICQMTKVIVDPIPTFNVVPAAGAARGVYDVMMGGKYLAVLDSGMVVFTTVSSGGAKYITFEGQTFITSLFSFACDGLITTGIPGLYAYNFGYIDDSGILYAQPDCKDCNPLLETLTSKRSIKERSQYARISFRLLVLRILNLVSIPPIPTSPTPQYTPPVGYSLDQWGNQPRCPNFPIGLTASVRLGARAAEVNGCGSAHGLSRYFVPNAEFEPCCNKHDLCFGTPFHAPIAGLVSKKGFWRDLC
jgi:hypothetical protein